MTSHRYTLCSAVTVMLVGLLGPASATAGERMDNHDWSLDIGAYLVSTKTDVRADGTGRTGSTIDVEEELGFEDVDRIRVDGAWRFAKRHTLRAMYFDNSRTSRRAIDRTIEFGDLSFPAGVSVDSNFDTRIADLTYEYSFVQRPTYELGASFGLHYITFKLALAGQAYVGNAVVQAQASEAVDSGAPMPLIGLRGAWKMSDQWFFNAHAKYFAVELEGFDGSISDLYADVTWRFSKHFGIGLGYNEFRFQVDVERRLFLGQLGWRYGGAMAFLKGTF